MTPLSALRSSGALVALPVMLALCGVTFLADPSTRTGYAIADLAAQSLTLSVVAPLVAGCTAFALRGRRELDGVLRSTRRGTWIVLASLWPLWLGAVVVTWVSMMIAARTVPNDPASWTLMAQVGLAVVTAGVVGAAAAAALPAVVAVPSASVAIWVWTAVLYSLYRPSLNYVSPVLDCCSQDQQPAVGVVLIRFGVMVAAAVGLLLLFWSRRWSRRPRTWTGLGGLAAIMLAAAVAVGLMRFTGVDTTPGRLGEVSARTTPLRCESASGIDVCLWPEGGRNAAQIGRLAGNLNTVLDSWGLPPIDEIGQGGLRPGAVDLDQSVLLGTDADALGVLVRGYVRHDGGCGPRERQPGDVDRWAVRLTMAAGVDRDAISADWGPESAAESSAFLARGPQAAGAAFRAGRSARECRGS